MVYLMHCLTNDHLPLICLHFPSMDRDKEFIHKVSSPLSNDGCFVYDIDLILSTYVSKVEGEMVERSYYIVIVDRWSAWLVTPALNIMEQLMSITSRSFDTYGGWIMRQISPHSTLVIMIRITTPTKSKLPFWGRFTLPIHGNCTTLFICHHKNHVCSYKPDSQFEGIGPLLENFTCKTSKWTCSCENA